jgi:hypothetical protein
MEALVSASDYGSDVRQFAIVKAVAVIKWQWKILQLHPTLRPLMKKTTLQKRQLCSSLIHSKKLVRVSITIITPESIIRWWVICFLKKIEFDIRCCGAVG